MGFSIAFTCHLLSFVSAHILSKCTRMPFVCQSYVLVCHLYVTRMYSYVIRMSFACPRMSSVCHSYVLVCHPYVTHIYSYVNRMSLVSTRMSSVCHSYVVLPWTVPRKPFRWVKFHALFFLSAKAIFYHLLHFQLVWVVFSGLCLFPNLMGRGARAKKNLLISHKALS